MKLLNGHTGVVCSLQTRLAYVSTPNPTYSNEKNLVLLDVEHRTLAPSGAGPNPHHGHDADVGP